MSSTKAELETHLAWCEQQLAGNWEFAEKRPHEAALAHARIDALEEKRAELVAELEKLGDGDGEAKPA